MSQKLHELYERELQLLEEEIAASKGDTKRLACTHRLLRDVSSDEADELTAEDFALIFRAR